jgi:hypothetical protein
LNEVSLFGQLRQQLDFTECSGLDAAMTRIGSSLFNSRDTVAFGEPLTGHKSSVNAVALSEVEGVLIVVAGIAIKPEGLDSFVGGG